MSSGQMFLFALSLTVAVTATHGMEAERLPDPTRPPGLHQAAVQRLAETRRAQYSVTAIKISAEERRALVNGQLLSEGDRIGDAVVVKIDPGAIVIEYLSERQRYKLLPYSVRRAPAHGSQSKSDVHE